MLDKLGFDLWANNYDKSVKLSEETNSYPFAGYKEVLNEIYKSIKTLGTAKILDIGFGTAVLASKLYEEGYKIYGIDFSDKMINIAKSKMPNATLIKTDFNNGLPMEIENEKFDFIICTYAIHHLKDSDKVNFIKDLLDKNMNVNGKIFIGDVAFVTNNELHKCKFENLNIWDDDEIYITLENMIKEIPTAKFHKITFCSGVLTFER